MLFLQFEDCSSCPAVGDALLAHALCASVDDTHCSLSFSPPRAARGQEHTLWKLVCRACAVPHEALATCAAGTLPSRLVREPSS